MLCNCVGRKHIYTIWHILYEERQKTETKSSEMLQTAYNSIIYYFTLLLYGLKGKERRRKGRKGRKGGKGRKGKERKERKRGREGNI